MAWYHGPFRKSKQTPCQEDRGIKSGRYHAPIFVQASRIAITQSDVALQMPLINQLAARRASLATAVCFFLMMLTKLFQIEGLFALGHETLLSLECAIYSFYAKIAACASRGEFFNAPKPSPTFLIKRVLSRFDLRFLFRKTNTSPYFFISNKNANHKLFCVIRS